MKHERKFRQAEEWNNDYDYGRRKKDKGRKRGKGQGELFAEQLLGKDLPYVADQTAQSQPQPQNQERPAFRFNEETTIDVKGYKIDLSRVKDIKKAEATYNNRPSHGIEFSFMGKNGYGRTIWYGTNVRQRDEEFAKYLESWQAVVAGR